MQKVANHIAKSTDKITANIWQQTKFNRQCSERAHNIDPVNRRK